MVIINPDDLDIKTYRCNKKIADWLMYKRNILLFGKKDDYYYFLVNDDLENSLKVMPIMMRISFGIFG